MKTKVFRRILAIMMIVCLIFGNLTMAFAEENTATTLRLAKTEGTVAVKNRNGKEMTILDDMKLYNGYHVGTGEASYAWMNLDDSKMAKLDAVSEAEVRQRGKEFELMLDSGNLFFNVTSPLSADETLNIRTSTMVTGIRGTAGWVKVISQWQTKVYILEGTVTVSVTDPVTGQVKTATLGAGQVAECWVYDQNRAGDKCDILMGRFSETDVDGFVAAEFVSNGALKNRVAQGGSGLDAEKIANGAAAKLQSDQNQIHQLLADVDRNLQSQDNNVLIDPVFTERATTAGTSTGGSGGGGGGGGGGGSHSGGSSSGTTNGGNNSNTTTEPSETVADPTTLTMPQTAATVNEYLNDKHVSVVLQGTGNDTFSIDSNLNVPGGKTLSLENGMSAVVEQGNTLSIDGTMNVSGSMTNNGTITNTSANSLHVGGTLVNNGTIDNSGLIGGMGSAGLSSMENGTNATISNTGTIKIADNGQLSNGGTLSNQGTIEGKVTETNGGTSTGGEVGDFHISQGKYVINGGVYNNITVTGTGELEVIGGKQNENGTILVSDGGKLMVSGGAAKAVSITGSTSEAVIQGGNTENISLQDGSLTIDGGKIPTLDMKSGTLNLKNGTLTDLDVKAGKVNICGGIVEGEVSVNADMTLTDGVVKEIITVNGGNFSMSGGEARDGVEVKAGTAEFLGGTLPGIAVTGENAGLMITHGTIPELILVNGAVTANNLSEIYTAQITGGLANLNDIFVGQLQIDGGVVMLKESQASEAIASNGSFYLEDSIINCGVSIQGNAKMVMNGGTITSQNDNPALIVNTNSNEDEIKKKVQDNAFDVILNDAKIYGSNGVSALHIMNGTVKTAGTELEADKAMNTVHMEKNAYVYFSSDSEGYWANGLTQFIPICKNGEKLAYSCVGGANSLAKALKKAPENAQIVLDGEVDSLVWSAYDSIRVKSGITLDLCKNTLYFETPMSVELPDSEMAYFVVRNGSLIKPRPLNDDWDDAPMLVLMNGESELHGITIDSQGNAALGITGNTRVLLEKTSITSSAKLGTVLANGENTAIGYVPSDILIENTNGIPVGQSESDNLGTPAIKAMSGANVYQLLPVDSIDKGIMIRSRFINVAEKESDGNADYVNGIKISGYYYYCTEPATSSLFEEIRPVVTSTPSNATPSNADESPVQEARLATASNWKASSKATPSDATPSDAEADPLSLDTWQNRAAVADDDEDDDEPFDDEIFLIDDRKTTYWKEDEDDNQDDSSLDRYASASSWWESIKARYKKEEES